MLYDSPDFTTRNSIESRSTGWGREVVTTSYTYILTYTETTLLEPTNKEKRLDEGKEHSSI